MWPNSLLGCPALVATCLWSAALAGCTRVGAASGSGSVTPGVMAPAALPDSGTDQIGPLADTIVVPPIIAGRVVVDHSGAPIEGVRVTLLEGGVSFITDVAGRFTLRAPSDGNFDLRLVRIGYSRRELPVRVDPLASPDTIIIRMEDGSKIIERHLADLRKPTAETPCRPYDETGRDHEEALADFLDSEREPYPSYAPALGLGRFMDARPRHVVDRALCRRATAAIDAHRDRPGGRSQVHLFRIGRAGYAAYDPSIRDGEWEVMYWFDGRMRLLTSHQW